MKGVTMTKKPKPTDAQFDRPRGKFVQVRFGDIVQILAMIDTHGQSKKLASKTKSDAHKVRIPAETVIAVKALVAGHSDMSRSALGKRVLYAKKARPVTDKVVKPTAAAGAARPTSSVATGDNQCCGFDSGG
jgi:hypothetical protein